jgi:hypothetical protein
MWNVITWNERKVKINHYCRKLAEIDYMLFVIDKDFIPRQKELYGQYSYSELKEMLTKRLLVFAETELYRDLNETQNKPKSLSA